MKINTHLIDGFLISVKYRCRHTCLTVRCSRSNLHIQTPYTAKNQQRARLIFGTLDKELADSVSRYFAVSLVVNALVYRANPIRISSIMFLLVFPKFIENLAKHRSHRSTLPFSRSRKIVYNLDSSC